MEKFQEAEARREQEQLIDQKPEILGIFHGFGENGYEDADKDLGLLDQHQLAVKIVERLLDEKSKLRSRVLKERRMGLLSNIRMIGRAIELYKEWVLAFEKENRAEIAEAMEAGWNLRVLSDVVEVE